MAKYTENGTEPVLEVDVSGLPSWEGEPALCVVTYPNGRIYGLTRDTAERLFTIISPQEVTLTGVGNGAYERPLRHQGGSE